MLVRKNCQVVPNNTQSSHRLFDGSKAKSLGSWKEYQSSSKEYFYLPELFNGFSSLGWGVRQKSRVVPKN